MNEIQKSNNETIEGKEKCEQQYSELQKKYSELQNELKDQLIQAQQFQLKVNQLNSEKLLEKEKES